MSHIYIIHIRIKRILLAIYDTHLDVKGLYKRRSSNLCGDCRTTLNNRSLTLKHLYNVMTLFIFLMIRIPQGTLLVHIFMVFCLSNLSPYSTRRKQNWHKQHENYMANASPNTRGPNANYIPLTSMGGSAGCAEVCAGCAGICVGCVGVGEGYVEIRV